MHPSQGKRARDLEAGSRTIRVSLLFSWCVSVVRVYARLIDSPLNPVSWPWFPWGGVASFFIYFLFCGTLAQFSSTCGPWFSSSPFFLFIFPCSMTSFTGFGPRSECVMTLSSLALSCLSVPSALTLWSSTLHLWVTCCASSRFVA